MMKPVTQYRVDNMDGLSYLFNKSFKTSNRDTFSHSSPPPPPQQTFSTYPPPTPLPQSLDMSSLCI